MVQKTSSSFGFYSLIRRLNAKHMGTSQWGATVECLDCIAWIGGCYFRRARPHRRQLVVHIALPGSLWNSVRPLLDKVRRVVLDEVLGLGMVFYLHVYNPASGASRDDSAYDLYNILTNDCLFGFHSLLIGVLKKLTGMVCTIAYKQRSMVVSWHPFTAAWIIRCILTCVAFTPSGSIGNSSSSSVTSQSALISSLRTTVQVST